jgi:hypothetical protein
VQILDADPVAPA